MRKESRVVKDAVYGEEFRLTCVNAIIQYEYQGVNERCRRFLFYDDRSLTETSLILLKVLREGQDLILLLREFQKFRALKNKNTLSKTTELAAECKRLIK